MAELAATERKRLAELEETIQDGIETAVKASIRVGHALAEIHDSRLYRRDYETFESYCRERWDIGRSRAYQLMKAGRVSTVVDISNEAQARELTGRDDEEIRALWDKAVAVAGDSKKVTAAGIREARKVLEVAWTEEGFRMQFSPRRNGNVSPAPPVPFDRLLAAIEASERCRAAANAIRGMRGLPVLSPTSFVAKGKARLAKRKSDRLGALIARTKEVRSEYPADERGHFDEALAALRRVRR